MTAFAHYFIVQHNTLQYPTYFPGSIPSVSDGITSVTGCINRDRECCIGELDLKVKNCTAGFVVYHLIPTPSCNMGYCAGQGVPCPKGLASKSGYTPCDCKFGF